MSIARTDHWISLQQAVWCLAKNTEPRDEDFFQRAVPTISSLNGATEAVARLVTAVEADQLTLTGELCSIIVDGESLHEEYLRPAVDLQDDMRREIWSGLGAGSVRINGEGFRQPRSLIGVKELEKYSIVVGANVVLSWSKRNQGLAAPRADASVAERAAFASQVAHDFLLQGETGIQCFAYVKVEVNADDVAALLDAPERDTPRTRKTKAEGRPSYFNKRMLLRVLQKLLKDQTIMWYKDEDIIKSLSAHPGVWSKGTPDLRTADELEKLVKAYRNALEDESSLKAAIASKKKASNEIRKKPETCT